jgi:PRC-barrel domain protein
VVDEEGDQMATPSIELARGWIGRNMVDRDYNTIGKVVDIYLDNETGRPEWAVVRTGLLGMRSSFVPLADATEVDDEVQVPHPRTQVKEAPSVEPDGQLSPAEEAELYRHYGLDYDGVALDDGAPAGSPGAGSAPQPEPSAIEEHADATGISAPESASTAGERLSDPDASTEPPATVGSEPGAALGEDRLRVGEGVSRPFVYETPGPTDDAGSRRRQPGQVRLRRYLVTEVVTDSDSGQRHELQVQSEPVSDAEVDALSAAVTDQPDQATSQEPTGPTSSDWFSDGSDPRR